jgi:hypothetical protein
MLPARYEREWCTAQHNRRRALRSTSTTDRAKAEPARPASVTGCVDLHEATRSFTLTTRSNVLVVLRTRLRSKADPQRLRRSKENNGRLWRFAWSRSICLASTTSATRRAVLALASVFWASRRVLDAGKCAGRSDCDRRDGSASPASARPPATLHDPLHRKPESYCTIAIGSSPLRRHRGASRGCDACGADTLQIGAMYNHQ